jgi:uncharacterized protein (TIGR03000 family)
MSRRNYAVFALPLLAFAALLIPASHAFAQGVRFGGQFPYGGGWGYYPGYYSPYYSSPYGYYSYPYNSWYGYPYPGYYPYRNYSWSYYPSSSDNYLNRPYPASSYIYQPAAEPTNTEQPVMVRVRVPADAEIWLNGTKTTATGPVRDFVSPRLEPGNYEYEIRARWMQNGRPVEQTRKITVRPGERREVDFAVNTSRDKATAARP